MLRLKDLDLSGVRGPCFGLFGAPWGGQDLLLIRIVNPDLSDAAISEKY